MRKLIKIQRKKKNRRYPIRQVRLNLKRMKNRNSKGLIKRKKMLIMNHQRALQMNLKRQMLRLALKIPMLNQAQR